MQTKAVYDASVSGDIGFYCFVSFGGSIPTHVYTYSTGDEEIRSHPFTQGAFGCKGGHEWVGIVQKIDMFGYKAHEWFKSKKENMP